MKKYLIVMKIATDIDLINDLFNGYGLEYGYEGYMHSDHDSLDSAMEELQRINTKQDIYKIIECEIKCKIVL